MSVIDVRKREEQIRNAVNQALEALEYSGETEINTTKFNVSVKQPSVDKIIIEVTDIIY